MIKTVQVHCHFPSWPWDSVDGAISYQFDDFLLRWRESTKLVYIDTCIVESVVCGKRSPNDDTCWAPGGRAILTGALVPVELGVIAEGNLTAYIRTSYHDSARITLDRSIFPTIEHPGRWTNPGSISAGCCAWEHTNTYIPTVSGCSSGLPTPAAHPLPA